MSPDQPAFQVYRGSEPPHFAHQVELVYARLLDHQGVAWEYEPRTFVLERDEEGQVTEAMTPDFYLPDENVYVEITVMRQKLVTKKNQKLRKLRARYPDVQVRMLYRRDLERLGGEHGFTIPAA